MVDLSTLNCNQRKAVQWNEGPLLVLAGPGSGKTSVLVYRIARLVEESEGKHFRILALAFTNRAAAEMRSRINALAPQARERAVLTTFHSFSVQLLRQHGHHIGLRPDFTILSQQEDREYVLDESIQLARQEYPEVAYRGELLPLVTRLLDLCIAGEEAVGFLRKRRMKGAEEIGKVYRIYRELMKQRNELDFGGILTEALDLFRKVPGLKRLVTGIYPFICVDEFQDTNWAQYRILCHLVDPDTKNLFVVADGDQTIYQWNGADPERLDSLRSCFDMSVLQLPENYRCPRAVIEIANNLIQHNSSRSSNQPILKSRKQQRRDSDIRVCSFPDFKDESLWIASDIADRFDNPDCDFAVLARTRQLLEKVHAALEAKEIPSYLAMRKDEFATSRMIWLHSMLRLANSRQDHKYLRRICRSWSDLEGASLDAKDIAFEAASEEGDCLRAWQRAALREADVTNETRRFLLESVSKLADSLDFETFVNDSFAWFDELPDFRTETPETSSEYPEYLEEKKTWKELQGEIFGELSHEAVTLNALLQGLDLRAKTPTPQDNAVPCFTVHASKGLEFGHVYLVGLVNGHFPDWRAIREGTSSDQMEEERRSCFVAITRAQKTLTLTYSNKVFGWTKQPSVFLKEIGSCPECETERI